MRKHAAISIAIILMLALSASAAFAHHDGEGNLPENNPHSAGVPELLWDAGTDALVITDEQDNPTGIPVVLDLEPLEFDDQNYWFIFRIGDGEEAGHVASRFEGGLPTGDVLWDYQGDLTTDDFVNARTGVSVSTEDYIHVEQFPHEHHLVLHAGTDRERCVDLANEQELNNPNQHNAVHIGAPSQHTSAGFANAGHEIRFFTCAESGF
jgi:hypothetical protein